MFFKKTKKPENVTITYNDFKELEKLCLACKNAKVKRILEYEVDQLRHKFVTRILNEEVSLKQTVKEPEKPTKQEFDIVSYYASSIRGFVSKITSIKEMLPDQPTRKIKEVLIRCKGREDDAVNCLLTGEGPKMPQVPKEVLQKHEDEYLGKLKEYDEKLKLYEKQKKGKIVDIEPDCSNETEFLNRISLLKKQLKVMDDNMEYYSKVTGKEIVNDDDDENSLYLPGEKKAILNNEPRIFTFHTERTFSNEVNHIHFRICESQFHRLIRNPFLHVVEVKYLVTPHLLQAYELKKKEFENEGHNEQYLMFSAHKYTKDEIEWIRLNNYRTEEFKNGKIFSIRNNYCTSKLPQVEMPRNYNYNYGYNYQQQQKKEEKLKNESEGKLYEFLFSLVVTGRAKKTNIGSTEKSFKRPSGYDSIISSESDHIVIFDQNCVLPFYIVKYEFKNKQMVYNDAGQNKHLDEEWNDMKKNAEADKLQQDTQKFYAQQLAKKEKLRKMGLVDPSKNQWMKQYLTKKAEREKGIMGKEEKTPIEDEDVEFEFELEEPETPLSGGDLSYDSTSPTPIETPISDGIFEYEIEEDDDDNNNDEKEKEKSPEFLGG